jgi:murein DD-endopeptidase MepM/ murein hydrolase activator NlpD
VNKLKIYLTIAFVALVGLVLYYFLAIPEPQVSLAPDTGLIGVKRNFTLKLDGQRGILKKLSITAVQADKKISLLVKEYPPGSHQASENFDLAKSDLKEGLFTLQVTASTAPPRFGAEKSATLTKSFTLENKPPDVAIMSIAHNITQGGVGLVIYTISKEVEKSGVISADRFSPGYLQKGNTYACLFPLPYDLDPGKFVPTLLAVDKAGNERLVTIAYHLIPKTFSTDQINLNDTFLAKIAAEFKDAFPEAKSPLDIFLKANRDQRQQDRKLLNDYGQKSSPTPLWQGTFLRMPNSAPLGGFAQARTYLYQGQEVDRQTHLGFDLASLAHATVPAANRGKVLLAGRFGIYGNCILLDHGLGLQTIYGHLSQLSVKAGDMVEKGQILGNTGVTGMAGGDHLHYEVLVSGQSVNPIEWWDAHWLKNNITGKLELASGVKVTEVATKKVHTTRSVTKKLSSKSHHKKRTP